MNKSKRLVTFKNLGMGLLALAGISPLIVLVLYGLGSESIVHMMSFILAHDPLLGGISPPSYPLAPLERISAGGMIFTNIIVRLPFYFVLVLLPAFSSIICVAVFGEYILSRIGRRQCLKTDAGAK